VLLVAANIGINVVKKVKPVPITTPKVSVIGTGQMGSLHARLLSQMGYLDSLVDKNINNAEKLGKKYNVQYFDTISALAENRSPNGLIIAVPTQKHYDVTVESIDKLPSVSTVLIEKPVAFSIEVATDLKKFFESRNISVIVGHTEIYNPVVPKIIDFIENKAIGDIRSIVFQRRGALTEKDLQSLGDVYFDVGTHDFSVVSKIFPGKAVNLFASSTNIDGIDNSSTIVMFPDDNSFYITFILSREFAGKTRTVDIEGSTATLTANFLTQMLEIRSLEIALGDKKSSSITIPFSSGELIQAFGEPLLNELWNLIDCIQNKGSPIVTLDDAIQTLKVATMVRKSIRERMIVKLTL
jgi:predicted dehydrogenase